MAAELLQAALRLADPADVARRRVVPALALNLAAAGRHSEAQELCRQALEDDPATDAEGVLRLCLAESLLYQGRMADALAEAHTAASSPALSERDRARALGWIAVGAFYARDHERALAAAQRALASGKLAGHAGVVAKALVILGHLAGFQGDFLKMERLLGEAADVAQRDGTPEAYEAMPQLDHATALADCDRFEDAVRAIAAGRRTYGRLGLEQAMAMSSNYAGYALFVAGEWDDALAEWQTADALGEELGSGWQADSLAACAVIAARRGELEDARRLVDRVRGYFQAGAFEWRIGWLAWAQAIVAIVAIVQVFAPWQETRAGAAKLGTDQRLEPESAVAWEGERLRGTVRLEPLDGAGQRTRRRAP